MRRFYKSFSVVFFLTILQLNAQQIKGKLLLNKQQKTTLELTSKSAVQLFKEFKTNKYKIRFIYEAEELLKNSEEEIVVFFDFATVVKKDGKTIRKVKRHIPMPYFPGEMFLPAEAFDFIGILAVTSWDDMEKRVFVSQEKLGIMKSGKYEVELKVIPRDIKGEIAPVTFSFYVK